MLQCNLTFPKEAPEIISLFGMELKAATVGIISYVLMLVVAATSFISNFQKRNLKIGLLASAVIFLIIYCFVATKRETAEAIFAVFPLLAVGITPILGNFIDKKGKAASMLMLGSILLIVCHLTFAFVLPLFKGQELGGVILSFGTILVLGASFSLVPASLWPSVPKLVDSKVIGSAYALIFWIQNIGLWLFPLLIGKILDNSNPEILAQVKEGVLTSKEASVMYNYTNPLIMLACLGAVALLLGFVLKIVDKKKGIGLELPNIKE